MNSSSIKVAIAKFRNTYENFLLIGDFNMTPDYIYMMNLKQNVKMNMMNLNLK